MCDRWSVALIATAGNCCGLHQAPILFRCIWAHFFRHLPITQLSIQPSFRWQTASVSQICRTMPGEKERERVLLVILQQISGGGIVRQQSHRCCLFAKCNVHTKKERDFSQRPVKCGRQAQYWAESLAGDEHLTTTDNDNSSSSINCNCSCIEYSYTQ